MVLEVERSWARTQPQHRAMTGASVTPIMPAVWPFSEPQEPVTVYERVIRELDRAEGDLWRNEPSYYEVGRMMQTEQSSWRQTRNEIRLHIAVPRKQLDGKTITINDVPWTRRSRRFRGTVPVAANGGRAYTRQMFSATRLPSRSGAARPQDQPAFGSGWLASHAARRAISAREHQRWTA